MQIATTTKSIFYGRESWILFFVTIVVGVLAAFSLYSIDRFSLLYYADSVSHLVRAREFVDAINPGLFEQLGTAWLPLPHLLLLPFTLIEPLFRTGLAGAALNVPCLAFTSVFLYKIIKNHLNVGLIAIVGALLYVTNPNILYMSVTPMTEASFMLFFVGAAYFFTRWMSGPRKYLSLNATNEGSSSIGVAGSLGKRIGPQNYGQSSHVIFDLIMCSTFISLATLCRYEAWVLPLFFVSFVVLTTLRKQRYYRSRRYKVGIILVSVLSFSGIAMWLIWNTYAYNDPLEFTNAPYFSAAAQALERTNRAFLYLQPWNVISLYGITALAMYGPILLATAFIGYLLHRHLGKSEERRRRRNLYLFLAMPPLFTMVSLLVGIGEMNQREWFNSRFVIILAPLIILLCCVFLARLPHRFRRFGKSRYAFPLIVFILFAYQFLTPGLGVVTFLNANYQFDGSRPFQILTAEALASAYDGHSKIVIITGSSQHNKIMQASGIPLRQFDQILESGSYKESFKEPWLHSKYIILGKKPDPSANNVANYWLARQPLLERYYDTIYQDKYYKMMELESSSRDSSPVSNIGQSDFRITPETEDNLLLHSHIHLNVTEDGKHVTVPANIGIDPKLHKDSSLDIYGPQKSPLHTHTTSGTVHVESKIIANYTLGEFLNVWGLPLTGKTVNMTANGMPVADFRNHILTDGEYINLALCSSVASISSSHSC